MAEKHRFCAVCSVEIPPERIEVIPQTRLCLRHAQQIEKYGGEFLMSARQVRLGKAESLKKNYGDIGVTFRRNEEGLQRLIEDYEQEEWEAKR